MLVLEFVLDGSVTLTDRNTGKRVARVIISSIIQRQNHTAIRLGFEAPQHIAISRENSKGVSLRNGNGKRS